MGSSDAQSLLSARGLRCVRGDRELFTDLSLSLQAGELLQIHGANGSGKTTLLRIMCGLSLPDAGNVYWQGVSLAENRQRFLQNLSYVGHSTGIKLELSPLENLAFAAALHGEASRMTLQQALDRVELFGFENEPARTLSAGQRRRIGLARLLISPARAWILDEPFTALDKSGIRTLESLLHEHLESGGIVVLASHSPVNLHERYIKALHLLT
ncbi:MAG TPA: cytochrome c biogenesis heme-transporting ATPase CcmA [Gammaproteobacteria bacterium]|jgi:heme exporter protein A